MRRIVLFIALALCVGGGAMGQTAEKLIAKWKTMQGAKYENTTETRLGSFMVSQEQNTNLTPEEIALIKKSFKRSEQVQFVLDEDRREELEQDIRSRKGYETLFTMAENNEPSDSANMFQRLFESVFSLSFKVSLYGKPKGDFVDGFLMCLDLGDKVALAYTKCKIRKDYLVQAIQDGTDIATSDDEEYPSISWAKVTEDVDNGNVLFVIHGKEYPELRSVEEVKNYMIDNNIHWNKEGWIVGGSVKEKYPHTDRKVVIEFAETEKDAE